MVLSAEKYHKTNIVFCLQVAFSVLCCLPSEKNTLIRYFIFFNFFIVIIFFFKKIMKRILYSYKNNASAKAYVLTYSHLFAFKHFLC